ncbi:UrcA family protein [Parasphingorhabdus sp. JC815]|uniref:UrcA family protein n=1 Tax=Parasphingorhabdus sp. JC815 TaxID=3232140 RepID=UPI003457BF4A
MKNAILNKGLCVAGAITAMAVSAAGFSTTANAQIRETRSVEVSYADLDLTTADGQLTLEGRLKGAVKQVCGSFDRRSLHEMADHGNCVEEANLTANRAKVSLIAQAKAGTLRETAMVIGDK